MSRRRHRTCTSARRTVSSALPGNRTALLQLKRQIDRALEGEDSYPFEEEIYRDVRGEPFEVAVKLARRRSEMEEPVPRPGKTPEKLPWAERAEGQGQPG